jgi:hypothetical protein
MLALEIGLQALQQEFINGAVTHVYHNGKRWGRYLPNLTKDIKRIKALRKRSEDGFQLALQGSGKYNEVASPASVSGFIGQKETDLVAFYGNDFLEIVAIMEYWGLWSHTHELLSLTSSKH